MEYAVVVRNAVKVLGQKPILDNLGMAVPRGAIYGLLGASGCGKTTLLSCIVGSRTIDSGDVCVLGRTPPGLGCLIGYMPQDIALVGELTIKDCANYFGVIYGMTQKQIDVKYDFLEDLLQLPRRDKYVKNLSGGQQRRASLAVSLIHDPELVILDEPTVGLDPVLRQNIWDHLLEVAAQGNTIIITTHYIEEARQAHTIGLMRNGQLLEEGLPEALMAKYNTSSIESVFLKLCACQDQALGLPVDNNLNIELPHQVSKTEILETKVGADSEAFSYPRFKSSSTARTKALLRKNILRVLRHPGGLMFSFLLPLLEIITFFLSVGGIPQDLRLAIVNHELSPGEHCSGRGLLDLQRDGNYTCDFSYLSCSFLADFHNSIETKYIFEEFSSVSEAMAAAHNGHYVAVIRFGPDFTPALQERFIVGKESSNETLEYSEVSLWLDMTDGQMAFVFQQQMYDTYSIFAKALMTLCERHPRAAQVPVRFLEPVYGIRDPTYTAYIAPGVLVTLVFFLAVTVTSIIIIVERDEGVWSRSLVAGVSTNEILLSHILTQGCVMILQTTELLLVSFVGFQLRCVGSSASVALLLLVQGLCGMSTGLAISVFCNTVTASNLMSMGSFVPIIFLSGSLWPIEGMPTFMKWIALAMPTTLTTQAVRDVMEKGWSFCHPQVLLGYGVAIAWTAIFSLFSCMMLNHKGH